MPEKDSKKDLKPSFAYLIEKKREGGEFTKDEIRHIVDSIMDEEMPSSQQAALLMAIYFKNMSAAETAAFSEEMMFSGDTVDLDDISDPKISKVSTGGVGDKATIALAALAAATGVVVPTFVARDEDFVISTVDKMNAIPGFKSKLTPKECVKILAKIGCAIVEQNKEIAPIDETLYTLRQATATSGSLPLITSSILSKKFAEGCEGLVVDVKWGNGSSVRDLEQAKQLARTLTRVARSMKRKCVALVTDANQPLGNTVGTGLEILEVVELLKGEGPEDMKELVFKLGMEMVRLAGVAGSTLSAKQTIERVLTDGSALKKFREMVVAQGGKPEWIDNPDKFPKAKYVKKLPAAKRGYVHLINAGL
ncbi:MAG: thymidine phosphorylase, partial [Opitutales bacterium]|nr:thymidine phosphorylase [Opitutales bacterium]